MQFLVAAGSIGLLPPSWEATSPLAHSDLSTNTDACCMAGKLDSDLRYIVWPPETAPMQHSHPCCSSPVSHSLLQQGVSHVGPRSGLARFAAALQQRRPVRIAVLGSSAASVASAGCTAKVDASAQDWGEVSQRCPPGRGWARQFSEWLDAAFFASEGMHQVYALGRGGCGSNCWDSCMFTHIPAETELYILHPRDGSGTCR